MASNKQLLKQFVVNKVLADTADRLDAFIKSSVVPAVPQSALSAVRDPTTWTIFQHDGPNHLGLW